MKLVLVSAGKGSRLLPLTKSTPKPLLDLGDGTCLLERQIRGAIRTKYVEEIIVVTGYQADQMDAMAQSYKQRICIRTIFNPFYEISNNVVSVWCARDLLEEDDFMISNGDNIYHDSVWNVVRLLNEGIWLTISKKRDYDTDDMKVQMTSDGQVNFVSKTMSTAAIDGESVGLVVVKGERYRKLFVQQVLDLVRNKENLHDYFVWVPNRLVAEGTAVRCVEIDSSDWFEIDFPRDITELRSLSRFRVVRELPQ